MKMKSSGLRRLRLKKLLGGREVYGVMVISAHPAAEEISLTGLPHLEGYIREIR
jgi:hypothetical protein